MNLQYPIGEFQWPEAISDGHLDQYIADIEALPGQLRDTISGLDDSQLATQYRPEG